MGEVREYSSKRLRQDPNFLRNDFKTSKQGMPIIKKCDVNVADIQLLAVDQTRNKDNSKNIFKTVHFFVDDIKMDKYYRHPDKYLNKLAQYAHLLTPDYSIYSDMPQPLQRYNTFRNRWCGAFWQDYGISVIPTISWSNIESFEFCFEGIEEGSVVAISTLSNLRNKRLFLEGYMEMKKRINPRQVLCFGKAFPEMGDEVITVEYLKTRRRAG